MVEQEDSQVTFRKNLARLLLRNALDLLQEPSRRVRNGLDGIVTSVDDQLNISLREPIDSLWPSIELAHASSSRRF